MNDFLNQLYIESADHFFMNSAYLSELWTARDLESKMKSGLINGSNVRTQIDDEYRHAEMLKGIIQRSGFKVCENIEYAMQTVLFKKLGGLDLSDVSLDQRYFWGIHEILEKRAILNYRGYILVGKCDKYKKLLRAIINDEQLHLKKLDLSYEKILVVAQLDKWIHKSYLSKHLNKTNLLYSVPFWQTYFGKGFDK